MLTYLGGGSKNGVLGHNQDFLDQDRMVTKSEEQLEQEQEIKQEKKAIYEIYWSIFIHKSIIEFACVKEVWLVVRKNLDKFFIQFGSSYYFL